jgi:hypothetical protein
MLGRLRQVECLSPGDLGQLGGHCKTLKNYHAKVSYVIGGIREIGSLFLYISS